MKVGRRETEKIKGGWESHWPSTRFHLIDRDKLGALLPLNPTMGKAAQRSARRWNELLTPGFTLRSWTAHKSPDGLPEFLHRFCRKVAHQWIPPYPLLPEVLLFGRAADARHSFFYLERKDVWYVHPLTKPHELLEVIDRVLAHLPHGEGPESRRGLSDLRFTDWAEYHADARA